MWLADLDKEQLSGQGGDPASPSYGNRPPTGTLWPGGEISLVVLIKLYVLITDQRSLRSLLLETFTHTKQSGRDAKAANLNLL